VHNFFDGLRIRVEAAQHVEMELDRYLASRFNLAEILCWSENQVSFLLARLLNPAGGHGQGRLFLRLFLDAIRKACGENEALANILPNLDSVREETVTVEERTREGRYIDIVVRLDDFLIGIENKLGAQDQHNQLADYNAYLELTAPKRQYLLLFLSAFRPPSEISISRELQKALEETGRFMWLPYNSFLRDWAVEAGRHCEAEKVRWLLRDFAEWVDLRYPVLSGGHGEE
jgi:hypothetical protein